MNNRRTAVEIMVLTMTGIVAFIIVGAAVVIFITELRYPEVDTGDAVNGLMTLVSSILSALLGLLAGRASIDTNRRDP